MRLDRRLASKEFLAGGRNAKLVARRPSRFPHHMLRQRLRRFNRGCAALRGCRARLCPGLPEPSDPRLYGLPGRDLSGHRHAAFHRSAGAAFGPDRHRREQGRRQRHDGDGGGRPLQARRLYAGVWSRPVGERVPVQVAGIRSGQGFHPGRDHRGIPVRAAGQSANDAGYVRRRARAGAQDQTEGLLRCAQHLVADRGRAVRQGRGDHGRRRPIQEHGRCGTGPQCRRPRVHVCR